MKGLAVAALLWPALVAGQTAPPPPPSAETLPYVEAKPAAEPTPAPLPPPPLPMVEAKTVEEPAPQPQLLPPPPPVSPAPEPARAPVSQPARAPAAAPAPVPAPQPAAAPQAPPSTEPQAAAAPPTEGDPAAAPKKEEPEFVKGELTQLGVDRIITKRSRVVVSAGYNHLDNTEYGLIYPQLHLKFGELAFGVGVPLNIEIFNSNYPSDPAAEGDNHIIQFRHAGQIRKQDWDQPSDFARVLTFLTYGKKEDHVYLDVGQQHASTIGHGSIVRRYNGNVDINNYKAGLQFDAYNDYVGVEFMTNNVVMWEVMSALAFIKPISLFSDGWFAKSISLGVTAAVDREAPTSLKFDKEPACPVPGACPAANVPMVTDQNQLATNGGVLVLGGVDVEMKIVKTESVDIKPYVDYSRFFLTGDLPGATPGGGLTVGLLGRFNAGKDPVHAFRLVAELRLLEKGFTPHYFDTFYEIDKVLNMGTGGVKSGSGQVPLTKLQSVVGDSTHAALPARTGYYVEASYGVRDAIGLTFALEGDSASPNMDFVAHLEIPWLSWLQVFGTLYVRGFNDFGTLVKFDEHTIAFAGVRIKPLPILFINLGAYKTFQLDAYKTKENGSLGSLQYTNSVGFSGDLGVGWEF
ncbi:MAG TPA: hypothetical protein VGK67_25050 [Myxococcales bacterium]|jgi:hypothetical protein